MAALPRLSPAAEHRLLKVVCGLPRGVQRRLFGAPPQVEGQTLASDVHALVRIAALARGEGLSGGVAVDEARAERRREAEVVGARPPIPMGRVESVEVPGPGGTLGGRLYVPRGLASEPPHPLLVYYHGGGWVIGDLDTHDSPCRFLAAHAGVQVLAVDYRLAPEHPFPAAAEDAFAAYEWASAHAGRLGCDPARIGVGGDSAGANLAAVACLQARDAGVRSPALQLLIYPVTDSVEEMPSRRLFGDGFLLTKPDMDFFEDTYLPPGADRGDPRVSVLRAGDHSQLPPAYVATAGFDPLRDEGEAYALRLREAGVQVALRRHPGLIHTFANLTAICPSARAAMLEAAGALRLGLSG
ncbi:MAG TPA: alpha/beta hydrolase [Solirubrobacterales bacterium]|nr:alpha/beta hydrolase [Solirubrobacterales bacterium]